MTKKIFLGMSAMAMLFATSCKDDFAESFVGDQATVEFSISTPEIGTRAYSDGTTATKLQYAVYDADGTELTALRGQGEKMVTLTNGKANVKLDLTTGESYQVIFWADAYGNADNAPYTVDFDTKTMKVNYNGAVSNDENRDAFYVCKPITVKGAQTETIQLTRPFAQLNIGTSDYAAAAASNYEPKYSKVVVKQLKNQLNLLTGAVEGTAADITFGYSVIPNKQDGYVEANKENFPVTGYEYLAMNYLLVPADKGLVDVEFGYSETVDGEAKTRTISNVPVQRNYRTNIYGKLLTSTVEVNVEIEPEYNGALTADDLQLAAAVGGTVTLEKDIVLNAPLNVQANMTLNLGGHTITTALEEEGRHYYAIENHANLVIEGDGAINARGIKNYGELTVNGNVTIKNIDSNGGAAIWNEGKVTINNGTFISSEGAGADTYGAALNTRASGEAVVNGGTFEAYSQLTYAIVNEGKMTINDAAVKGKHGAVAGAESNDQTTINGGSFKLIGVSGQSDHCAYCVSNIRGGVFSINEADASAGDSVFYSSPIADGYKAIEKDGKYYVVPEEAVVVTTAGELNNALANGGNVVLLSNINIGMINLTSGTSDVVIDANGFTIKTAANYGIQVTPGKNITIKNAKIGITVEGNYITYAAGLKIENGDYAGKTIKLENCEIRMANPDWAYAVNMPASVKNLNLVLDKCVLEGAIAVQCWGDNNNIDIANSKLICNYTTSALYTSYCVVLQGEGTNISENNTLIIDNCDFSYTGVDNFNSLIYSIGNRGSNNTISAPNCTYGEKIKPYN